MSQVSRDSSTTAASSRRGGRRPPLSASQRDNSSNPSISRSGGGKIRGDDAEDDADITDTNATREDAAAACSMLVLPAILVGMALALSFAGGFWCTLAVLPVVSSDPQGTSAESSSSSSPQPQPQPPEWIRLVSGVQYGLMSQQRAVVKGISTTPDASSTNNASNPEDSVSASAAVYVESSCVAYPSGVPRDGSWSAAHGLQIAAWAVSGLVWVVLLWLLLTVALRRAPPAKSGGILAVCGFGAVLGGVVLQGLVFLFYQSDLCTDSPMEGIRELQQMGVLATECQLGSAAVLLIAAMALYFAAGVAACAAGRAHLPPPRPQRRRVYPRARGDSEGDGAEDNNSDADV